MMTLDNTEGYSQKELDTLNTEFEKRFENGDWDGYGMDRDNAEKAFSDEVAGI